MKHPLPRLVPSTLAVFALTAAALLSAAPLTASAVGIANPVCPQARANVGVAIVPSNALSPDDHAVHVTIDSGSLPAGVTLNGLARVTPYVFSGTPTTPGTSNFVVKAQFEDAPAVKISCTIKVGTLPTTTRVAGADRYAQAVEVSKAIATSDLVYLASGEQFADALSAGSVAGIHGAPLLLTQAKTLPAATAAELTKRAPKNIVVVGGASSVSAEVLAAVKKASATSTITRISGADRYEGSRKLIADATFGVPAATGIYLADGRNFPDALAASPAANSYGGPVMLVNGAATAVTPTEVQTVLNTGAKNVRIAGGAASVSAAFEASLKAASGSLMVNRVSGADRYDGAVKVNEQFTTAETVYLASGEVFPDALSAAPVAGETQSPVYLVQKGCVPGAVLDALEALKPTKIVVLGGTSTVSDAVAALKPC